MKTGLTVVAIAALTISTVFAASFSEWQFKQEFEAPGTGLIKISLSPEILGTARANFSDVRLLDSSGLETPYLIDHPLKTGRAVKRVKSFKMELIRNTTMMTLETGLEEPIGSIHLETPSTSFVKAASVFGSQDGIEWQTLVSGSPIFQMAGGATKLQIDLPAGKWIFLRIVLDDRDSQTIPFTGAQVEAAQTKALSTESVYTAIIDRNENAGETRVEISLPAANLRLASLEIETPDLLFRRKVTLSTRQVEENVIQEKSFASETIYRVAVAGQAPSEQVSIPLDYQLPLRNFFLRIQNNDSPPLTVKTVRVERWPVYLIFLVKDPGKFTLLSGNSDCAAPHYDLGKQGINITSIPITPFKMGIIQTNPDFQVKEVLPEVKEIGKTLDVATWSFRKQVIVKQPGLQQLDLDLEIMGRSLQNYADLRLMHAGRQIPFIMEQTAIRRTLRPESSRVDIPKQPNLSRWILKIPYPNLRLGRLTCVSSTPLFQRYIKLTEEISDERGAKSLRELGNAIWKSSPDQPAKQLTMPLENVPSSDTLFLETNNEDNPAIELADFEFTWGVTRLYFKTTESNDLQLYFGNSAASPPQYDLSLAAKQLLEAPKQIAVLGSSETLKKSGLSDHSSPGKGGILFWGVLAGVVITLFVVIAKLMPKPQA